MMWRSMLSQRPCHRYLEANQFLWIYLGCMDRRIGTTLCPSISIAPEQAKAITSIKLFNQFISKNTCPLSPAVTVRLAGCWSLPAGTEGFKHFLNLPFLYGTTKANSRLHLYKDANSTTLPLPASFDKLINENLQKWSSISLEEASNVVHQIITVLAIAHQMRLSFQEEFHRAVDRLFDFLRLNNVGSQRDSMQELIAVAINEFMRLSEGFRVQLFTASPNSKDRQKLLDTIKEFLNVSLSSNIYIVRGHLRSIDFRHE